MKIRRIALILVISLFAGMLSACGSEKDGGLYEAVKQNGVLKAAVIQDNAPYSWYDTKAQEYAGIEIELLKEIALAFGVELQYYPVSKERLTEAVWSGEADIALGRMSESDASGYSVDLSTHYHTGFLYAVTLRGDFASTLDAFSGEPIGISDKLSEGAGVELYTIKDVVQNYYDTTARVEQDLLAGSITGYFCYEEEARELITSADLQVQTVTDYEPEKYCVAVQKNNPDVTELINAVIREMTESGKLADVILQYQ